MSDERLDLYGRTEAELALADLGPVPGPDAFDTPSLQRWLSDLPPTHREGRSETTWRAYASDLAHFATWCAAEGSNPLPADPDVVITYLQTFGHELSLATLQRRLAAVSVMHRLVGLPSPTATEAVRLTWAGMRRTLGPAAGARRVEAIVTPVLASLVAPLADTVMDHRDRALLVIGFAGAFRRSELSALDVEDVSVGDDALLVTIRAADTDRRRDPRTVKLPYGTRRTTCPVRSWLAWTQASGILGGPAFRSMTKGGRTLKHQRLSGQAIAQIIKRRAADVGLDPRAFSGHSLRAGFATAAAGAGLTDRSIMHQTGHRSPIALTACIRGTAPLDDNPAAHVGL